MALKGQKLTKKAGYLKNSNSIPLPQKYSTKVFVERGLLRSSIAVNIFFSFFFQIMPDRNKLTEMAENLNIATESFEEMCKDTTLNAEVVKELQSHGKKVKLERFEIPGAVGLCPELWTPESGLVTAAFKLKRKPIQDYYQKELKQMYEKR